MSHNSIPIFTDKLHRSCVWVTYCNTYYRTVVITGTLHAVRVIILRSRCIFLDVIILHPEHYMERYTNHNQCFYKIQFYIYSLVDVTFPEVLLPYDMN